MATKTPPDFDFLSDVTWDDLDKNGVSAESENGLCVPQDDLYEIELFPAFGGDLISLSGILLSSPQRESTSVDHRVNTNTPSISNNHYVQESEDKGKRVLHDTKQDPFIISKKRRSYRRRGCSMSWSNERKLRCTHCQAEKTPLWRAGPLGPKTLCNACGVRYKSGRLMPEYRPAASPSFDSRKHSNFHRNILRKLNQ